MRKLVVKYFYELLHHLISSINNGFCVSKTCIYPLGDGYFYDFNMFWRVIVHFSVLCVYFQGPLFDKEGKIGKNVTTDASRWRNQSKTSTMSPLHKEGKHLLSVFELRARHNSSASRFLPNIN